MIAQSAWATLDAGGDPFVSAAFLGGIDSLNSATRHPALVWPDESIVLNDDHGELAAMLPCYRRGHSFGDFSRDWGWPEAWQRAGLGYYPKLVSGIPYTPSPGPRLLVRGGLDHTHWAQRLVDRAIADAESSGASSWQCLFVEERDRVILESAGCLMRRGVQFHWVNAGWSSFDEFLASFSAEKRKKVKRERRSVAESGLRLEVLHGDEIGVVLWQQVHAMYADTFARYGNHPALPLEFFVSVAAALGQQLLLFVAWDTDMPVACAICYRDGHTLYGRHWGTRVNVSGLHFELCYYQGIDYCLQHGLSRFEPGAQGEHKLARGFVPTDTWCAYWICNPGMRAAVAEYLEREATAMDDYARETATHLPFRRDPL